MSSKKIIKRMEVDSGFSFDKMIAISPYAERKIIENKTKKRLIFPQIKDFRKAGRGNPLIARHAIKTMEEVDKELFGLRWKWGKTWK